MEFDSEQENIKLINDRLYKLLNSFTLSEGAELSDLTELF